MTLNLERPRTSMHPIDVWKQNYLLYTYICCMRGKSATPITILAVNSDHGLSFAGEETRTMVWVSFPLQIYSTFEFWRFKFSVVWVLVWVSSFYGDGGGSRTVKFCRFLTHGISPFLKMSWSISLPDYTKKLEKTILLKSILKIEWRWSCQIADTCPLLWSNVPRV